MNIPAMARFGPLTAQSLRNKTLKPAPRAILKCYNSKYLSSTFTNGFDWPQKVLSGKTLIQGHRRGLVKFVSPSILNAILSHRQNFHTTCRGYLDKNILKFRGDIENVYWQVKDRNSKKSVKDASKKIQELVKDFHKNNAQTVPLVKRPRLLFHKEILERHTAEKCANIIGHWSRPNKGGKNSLVGRETQEWGRVESVMGRLKEANSELRNSDFKIYILDNDVDEEYACSYPPGYIFLSKFDVNKRTDDQLAFLLGHECGHIILQHTTECESNKIFYLESMVHGSAVIRQFVDFSESKEFLSQAQSSYITAVFDTISKLIPNLTDKGREEFEADSVGLHCMLKANYNPESVIDDFDKGHGASTRVECDPESLKTCPLDKDENETLSVLTIELGGVIKDYILGFDLEMDYPSNKERAKQLDRQHKGDLVQETDGSTNCKIL